MAMSTGSRLKPAIERILLKTDLACDCWLYQGPTNGRGYGVIGQTIPDRRSVYVHRVMYVAAWGPLPEGCEVAHICDVRNCVRPTHLVPMTHEGNVLDAVGKRRHAHGSRHGSARLTPADVRVIRQRVAAGQRRVDVAAAFAVTVSNVDLIVARKRWADVD